MHLRPLGHLSRFGAFRCWPAWAVNGFRVAEREGFEPSVPLQAHLISNQVPSTTRTSLRGRIWQGRGGLSMSRAEFFWSLAIRELAFHSGDTATCAGDFTGEEVGHEVQETGPYGAVCFGALLGLHDVWRTWLLVGRWQADSGRRRQARVSRA